MWKKERDEECRRGLKKDRMMKRTLSLLGEKGEEEEKEEGGKEEKKNGGEDTWANPLWMEGQW